ncbi:DUF4292 domain-containing protein [Arenibacter sp. 6A1]|uniref:DUF4292 domain-containing protein n=1 Tax=Arenibacter sp. 6A1 TaxID=2720391 RepID=UPI0014465F44|nr:DUF4292 domain-containing protein [Arenibacter sp. 6A1]NKI26805.1 DUF4292 domain-containing protein [Arenibacter sp. 6A1]
MKNRIQKVQKWAVLYIFVIMAVSCKSTKISSDGTVDENMSAKAVIRNHYYSHLNFKTLSGRIKVDYSDGHGSQGVNVSIRMEKDKAIWLSAPLGVVKAFITPKRVSFYNKLDNEYFDGDFSYLSKLLGTDIDFEKIQSLLLGEALVDLRDDKYAVAIKDGNYELKPQKVADLLKTLFVVEPQNFKMASQLLAQPLKNRMLAIEYKNYQKISNWVLPNHIQITTMEGDKTNNIDIQYRNMEFNRALNFNYNIPNGYKQIVLK